MKEAMDELTTFEQLPLAMYSHPATFDNYYIYHGNREAVGALRHLLTSNADRIIYLWGPPGAGVSHLLQSFQLELAQSQQLNSQYLPLGDLVQLDPQSLFEQLEQLDILCIDDVHLIQNQPAWQTALFHLFNRLHDRQKKIVFGSSFSPRQLTIDLADLHSRLCSATVFQLHSMEDEHKAAALQLRANSYGLQLDDETIQYILRHTARDTKKLFELLQRLNRKSLAEQRKLTIPFIKKILQGGDSH